MANVKKSSEGVSQLQKFRVFYCVRKANETKWEHRHDVVHWEHHPMLSELGPLLVEKHDPGSMIGIFNWCESQEDCC